MRQLEADPKWVAEDATREARRAAREAQFKAEEVPIIADLAAVGVDAESVWDFVCKRAAPFEAIPVLVRHLGKPYSPAVQEGMIRAIGVPWARAVAFEMLCTTFQDERDPNMRFAIANALSGMALLDDVRELPGILEYEALFGKPFLRPTDSRGDEAPGAGSSSA
ncbi:MAG: hypothetical protein K1X57_00695 [Gemmataceae bacterium]|nr:hypothetical protein [Gemmataceae bacterium]